MAGKSGGKPTPGGSSNSVSGLTQDVMAAVGELKVPPGLGPDHVERIFKLALDNQVTLTQLRIDEQEIADRSNVRAHKHVMVELWLKFAVLGVSGVLLLVVIVCTFFTAKTEKDQEARVEKLLTEMGPLVGGIAGGTVIGRQWTKRH